MVTGRRTRKCDTLRIVDGTFAGRVVCRVREALNLPARRIALIRHGRSALEQRGWIDSGGVGTWRLEYEAAGIGAAERPPSFLEPLVSKATGVLCSTAPRAIETARLLLPTVALTTSSLLREFDLAAPSLGTIRLPLTAWALAIGARTWLQTRRGTFPTPAERRRVADAAQLLIASATAVGTLLVVTHAGFRHHLSAELERAGWNASTGRRSLRPWSAWVLTRD